MIRAFIVILVLLVCASSAQAYNYPYTDPYEATVFGTKPQDMFPVNALRPPTVRDLNPLKDFRRVLEKEVELEDRPVPEIFWYNDTLRYSVAVHGNAAPLIFVLAGTGSSHESATSRFLRTVFYYAGFHVVTLPSTTYPNFIVSASSTQVPGFVPQDAADLYGAMNAIVEKIGRDRVRTVYLTGYSLGATHAAFLGEIDSREKRLGVSKILLLNPAVNLLSSAERLDNLVLQCPNDQSCDVSTAISKVMQKLSSAYENSDTVNFGDDFLYELQKDTALTKNDLKVLIGSYFRLSLASMIFTSDVCTGAGYIVHRGHAVHTEEPLTPYLEAALGVSFRDFVTEYFIPYQQYVHPKMTRDDVLQACSLESISGYLQKTEMIEVMTNSDDFILSEDDRFFLHQTFGSRLHMYPHGGHCGNLLYYDNVAAMLHFFQK